MLQGNQIILRPVSPAALELMDQMNQDAETMRFIGGTGTPRSRIEQFIQEQQAQFSQQGWGWMTIETPQEKVGFVFLRQCPRLAEIELGYRLHRQFWGKGYATEGAHRLLTYALNELNFELVAAAVTRCATKIRLILMPPAARGSDCCG